MLDDTEIIGIVLYVKIITSPIHGVIPRIAPNPLNTLNSFLASLANEVGWRNMKAQFLLSDPKVIKDTMEFVEMTWRLEFKKVMYTLLEVWRTIFQRKIERRSKFVGIKHKVLDKVVPLAIGPAWMRE